MSANKPKQKISVTVFGFIKIEAEGLIGLSALLILISGALISRWIGLF